VLAVHAEQAEAGCALAVDRQGRDGDIGPGGVVPLQHPAEIHPVKLVPGEDEDVLVGMVVEMDEALTDGIGRALEPAGGLAGLLGGDDLDEAAGDEVVEPVGLLDVAV